MASSSSPSSSSSSSSSPSSSPPSLIQQFQQDGYLLIPNALTNTQTTTLKNIIDNLDQKRPSRDPSRHTVHKAVFESYPAPCLEIFKNEKILGLVRALLSMAGTSRHPDKSLTAHVIHNNAYKIEPGMRGQAPTWHTDDPPLFSGELPPNVHIAPLVLTVMYYLNDIREGEIDGMTHVIPGSHRLGRPCTREEAEGMKCVAPGVERGTALIISSALWHRGCRVGREGRARYVFQVSYGRRLVGHKHRSIMDYTLPRGVRQLLRSEEERQLMGYLQGGAYS